MRVPRGARDRGHIQQAPTANPHMPASMPPSPAELQPQPDQPRPRQPNTIRIGAKRAPSNQTKSGQRVRSTRGAGATERDGFSFGGAESVHPRSVGLIAFLSFMAVPLVDP